MMLKEADNFAARVRRAMTLPIRTRCAELTVLLDRGSTVDLQNFFPLLIDNIFGPQGTVSWGLRCAREYDEDFKQLEHFLSPYGPVFKLIYALLRDPSFKYDFPLIYLPTKVQQVLEHAHTHPFYADLMHVNPQTKHVMSLLLNPFDYYMFHFAYHLINPWHQRVTVTAPTILSTWNTVYYALACNYLVHFLPVTPGAQVQPVIFYSGKASLQPLPTLSPIGSKLINTSVLNKSIEEYSFHQNFGRQPRNHIWRSETVLTVFVDMWLNNDQISHQRDQLNNSSFGYSPSSVPRLLQYNELPAGEYMRIVRVLMKQLHSFSQSAKTDDTHMSELKNIAIPMVDTKFYAFLRNLVHRWPLDGSFRLLLELWLTYLQPWRYSPDASKPDPKKLPHDPDDPPTPPSVGREHLPFIAQNLLVYVVIFQQLLPRFSRVDLVSPKMSIMLYRISKVFNQPNLVDYLKEVEGSMDGSSPSRGHGGHWGPNLPPLSPTASWCSSSGFVGAEMSRRSGLMGERKWGALVKQRICELEGPGFCYKPLFVSPPAPEVFELILQIKRSLKVARDLAEMKRQEDEELHGSFFGLFKAFWSSAGSNDEFSLNERLKVPEYLDKALEHLKQLFQITDLPEVALDSSQGTSTGSSGLEVSNSFQFLTPEKVRERIKKIKYEGNPDLHPIRSTEVTVLVRMFYQLSRQINEHYRQQFCQLYYNQSYWGRLSRQFLAPPITVYKYDKTKPGSPRIGEELPPRITLRYFASYGFLTYFCLGGLVAFMLGYSIPVYLAFVFIISLLYKCIRAVAGNSVRHIYPTQGFGNISFDDSF